MSDFVDFVVESDEVVGTGGFLALRRLRLRNRRADGSLSAPYTNDLLVRPYGQDSVAVCIYARTATGLAVLLRECLRPSITFGRNASRAPLPEPAPSPFVTEIVAGIIEDEDVGEAGLRSRAAAEVREEAGFVVDPAAVVVLGAGVFPSPGALTEKVYFTAVEVDPTTQQSLTGDGSPMEEGATTRWLPLETAIAACARGDVSDMKTELGLYRLRAHFGA